MTFSGANDMTNCGRHVSNHGIVSISGETRGGQIRREIRVAAAAVADGAGCLSGCQSRSLRDSSESGDRVMGFNVKARTRASVDDETRIHRAAGQNKNTINSNNSTAVPGHRLPASRNRAAGAPPPPTPTPHPNPSLNPPTPTLSPPLPFLPS